MLVVVVVLLAKLLDGKLSFIIIHTVLAKGDQLPGVPAFPAVGAGAGASGSVAPNRIVNKNNLIEGKARRGECWIQRPKADILSVSLSVVGR